MENRMEQIIIVAIASFILVGVFGSIALFDRSHGVVGTEYGNDQVDVIIDNMGGNIEVPDLPAGIFIFGADQQASMDFKVTNMDPDNDIDTIFITIPGSIITNSGYGWYEDGAVHEWNMTYPQTDKAVYQARDDYPGINYGGSSQYDTAGGVDDALDHDSSKNISESITTSVEFTAPTSTGFKVGDQAINVEVADLLTENANPKESMDPFPYPYIVTQNGDTFVVMILETTTCDLEIVYDGMTMFGYSRASGFQTFQNGIKYNDGAGQTIVIVAHPGTGKIVKPIVRARTAGLTGQFTLTVFNFTVGDITTGATDKVPIVVDYKDDIPSDISTIVDNDIDGDGIYNKLDPDIDGDGQTNADDRDPYNRDVQEEPPTGLQASTDKAIVKEGGSFTLSAAATDPNGDPVTYNWTVDKVTSWTKVGQTVVVEAKDEFKAGTYIFSVQATDGRSTEKPTDTITVTIQEENGTSYLWLIIAAIALIFIVITVATSFFIRRTGDDKAIKEIIPERKVEISQEKRIDSVVTEPASQMIQPPENQAVPVDSKNEPASESEIVPPCPECGAALGPDDLKCCGCGAEFEIDLKCPTCWTVVAPESQNCPSCGIAFSSLPVENITPR